MHLKCAKGVQGRWSWVFILIYSLDGKSIVSLLDGVNAGELDGTQLFLPR